jgi:hypothetical protein
MGTLVTQQNAIIEGNFDPSDGDPNLVDAAGFDYRLALGSPCIDAGLDPGDDLPLFQYVCILDLENQQMLILPSLPQQGLLEPQQSCEALLW